MIDAITRFSSSVRGKWLVIVGWIIAAVVLTLTTPGIGAVLDNDSFSSVPPGSESAEIAEMLDDRFPSAGDGNAAIFVFRNPDGLTDANFGEVERLSDLFAGDGAPEGVGDVVSVYTQPQAAAGLQSEDGTTMTMIVTVLGDALDEEFADTVDALRDEIGDTNGMQVAVTGPAGIQRDVGAAFENIDGVLTIATVILILVLLIVIYRSPVVAVVPIFSVAWVLICTFALGSVALQALDLPANAQSQSIMTILLFGAGTDYCLFISSRFREELLLVDDKHEAMRRTMIGVGGSIVSAAGTVFVATIALLLAVVPSYRALGPLVTVAVGLLLIAGLTLLPAVLTILGRNAFWPFSPRYDPEFRPEPINTSTSVWARIARLVQRNPRTVLAGTIAFFLVTSVPILGLEQSYDDVSSLPSDAQSRTGFALLRQGFPAGELAPTEVYVVLPEGSAITEPETFAQIDALTEQLASDVGVASVSGPTRPFGMTAPVGPDDVSAAMQAVADGSATPDQQRLAGQVISFLAPDGDASRIEVVLQDNPFSLDALNVIPNLRNTLDRIGADVGLIDAGAELYVGGQTATAYDSKTGSDRDTLVLIPLVLLAIGVILGFLLQSIVAPFYLVATIIISYFSTLGIGVFVFEYVLDQDGLSGSVAFLSFIFIAALGVDYNIYLIARIREESGRHGLVEGTTRALAQTGGVITSAGVILAGTFSVLMILPLQALFQLGFIVAVGVLIDTFITRSLMVPAIVLILGKWNWWPGSDVAAGANVPQPSGLDQEPVRDAVRVSGSN